MLICNNIITSNTTKCVLTNVHIRNEMEIIINSFLFLLRKILKLSTLVINLIKFLSTYRDILLYELFFLTIIYLYYSKILYILNEIFL